MFSVYQYCLSSFLAFRYIVDPATEWMPGIRPTYPEVSAQGQISVETMEEIDAQLRAIVARKISPAMGILLSGGIDSAILAALLPQGARAYTIKFNADQFLDESVQARVYANALGLQHTVVEVNWEIPFEERIEIVRSIKYVDAAVPQNSLDKMEAWMRYHFDLMFVVDDWLNTSKWKKFEAQFKKVASGSSIFPTPRAPLAR